MPRTRALLLSLLAAAPTAAVSAADAHAKRLGTRPLERGDRGSDVRELQRALRAVRAARLHVDGAYGRRTRAAVVRYERRERLAVDGRVSTGQARGLLRRARMPVPPPVRPAAPVRASANGLHFPVAGPVTWGDGFGERKGGHDGVDLMASCGTPLVAVDAGTVRAVRSQEAAGRYVLLARATGEDLVYMHLRDVDVEAGQTVAAGQRLGTVGRTGNATACHLHFEQWSAPGWHRGGAPVDPAPLLRPLA